MRKNKIPEHIIGAIRRRAAAAEKWNRADEQITAYCERLGIKTEYINKNIETLFRYSNPEFFIHDLEKCLESAQLKTACQLKEKTQNEIEATTDD